MYVCVQNISFMGIQIQQIYLIDIFITQVNQTHCDLVLLNDYS